MDIRNFHLKEFHADCEEYKSTRNIETHPENVEAKKLIEKDKHPGEYLKYEGHELTLERRLNV